MSEASELLSMGAITILREQLEAQIRALAP